MTIFNPTLKQLERYENHFNRKRRLYLKLTLNVKRHKQHSLTYDMSLVTLDGCDFGDILNAVKMYAEKLIPLYEADDVRPTMQCHKAHQVLVYQLDYQHMPDLKQIQASIEEYAASIMLSRITESIDATTRQCMSFIDAVKKLDDAEAELTMESQFKPDDITPIVPPELGD